MSRTGNLVLVLSRLSICPLTLIAWLWCYTLRLLGFGLLFSPFCMLCTTGPNVFCKCRRTDCGLYCHRAHQTTIANQWYFSIPSCYCIMLNTFALVQIRPQLSERLDTKRMRPRLQKEYSFSLSCQSHSCWKCLTRRDLIRTDLWSKLDPRFVKIICKW